MQSTGRNAGVTAGHQLAEVHTKDAKKARQWIGCRWRTCRATLDWRDSFSAEHAEVTQTFLCVASVRMACECGFRAPAEFRCHGQAQKGGS
jgi:hypothetical protein